MFDQFIVLWNEFWSGLELKDAIQYIFVILAGTYGIYSTWQHSQRRLFHRLQEFIAKEEVRLKDARGPILSKIRRPAPTWRGYVPIYTIPSLASALRKFEGKNAKKTEAKIRAAAKTIQQRLDAAEKCLNMQKEQLATAHLALGCLATANLDDAKALGEFQEADRLCPDTPDFAEHIGLQCAKVGDAAEALGHFARMRSAARQEGNQLLVAWSHRHEGYAHWKSPKQSATLAQAALKEALDSFPTNAPPLDVASTWELHGKMRERLGALQAAITSYREALVTYSGQLHHTKGNEGLVRSREKIVELNRSITDRTDAIPQPTPPVPLTEEGNGGPGNLTAAPAGVAAVVPDRDREGNNNNG